MVSVSTDALEVRKTINHLRATAERKRGDAYS